MVCIYIAIFYLKALLSPSYSLIHTHSHTPIVKLPDPPGASWGPVPCPRALQLQQVSQPIIVVLLLTCTSTVTFFHLHMIQSFLSRIHTFVSATLDYSKLEFWGLQQENFTTLHWIFRVGCDKSLTHFTIFIFFTYASSFLISFFLFTVSLCFSAAHCYCCTVYCCIFCTDNIFCRKRDLSSAPLPEVSSLFPSKRIFLEVFPYLTRWCQDTVCHMLYKL